MVEILFFLKFFFKNSISFLLFILSFFPYIMFSQTWNKIGDDIIGENSADQSGISISLSGDGQKVAIGAWLNSGGALEKGHVRGQTGKASQNGP